MDESMRWVMIFFVAYIMLISTDSLIMYLLKDILFDFLVGTRNRKSAMRIHLSQSPEQRKTMAYIKPLLKDNVKAFVAFQRLYLVVRYTLIPQYALLIICNIVLAMFQHNSFYLLVGCILVKDGLFVFLRFQVNGGWKSKYAKGK